MCKGKTREIYKNNAIKLRTPKVSQNIKTSRETDPKLRDPHIFLKA